MRDKRGQAAVEFLMTYGWAILAAIIVIGVLAWYLTRTSLTPSSCELSLPLKCEAHSISATGGGTISMDVTNYAGDTITIQASTLTIGTVICTIPAIATPVPADGRVTLVATCAAGTVAVGDSVKAKVTVSYKKGTSGLTQTSAGSVSGKAAA